MHDGRRTLTIGPDAAWVISPAGARIALDRRWVLRRVLGALVTQRAHAPGNALDVHALFAAAWPGEKAYRNAAANRVYVAVARLRKMGLAGCLCTGPGGFYLDPSVTLLREPSTASREPAATDWGR